MSKIFDKRITDWRNERLTDAEKSHMLANIFATPIESPYTKYLQVLVYIKRPVVGALLACLILSSSVVYASQNALPGEKLYAVKTRVVEPVLDALNTLPAQRLARQEEKVVIRLAEAKALATQDKLDERRVKILEERIEESSTKFSIAAEEVVENTATTTKQRDEKREELRNKFREKIAQDKEREEDQVQAGIQAMSASLQVEDTSEKSRDNNRDQIERLKDRALRVLEERREKRQSRD